MRPSIVLATGVAALGSFLFGYDTTVIAGAVGSLRGFTVCGDTLREEINT